ncbi:MAG: flagellar biosynthesis anti-sigma factor FlgM [Vallitaleaceae bacterium]|nr:flagellar biosynthesis anti-sigma factor FlgM [Vallitaleaceae bacterium]
MMRINGMNNVGNVYKPNKANKAYGNSAVATSKDEVTFSSFAMELAGAKKEVDKVPDVRMDKVNDIKAQIEAGKYNIAASQIADKLLGRI